MAQQRDQLVDRYADHFARLNQTLDARTMSAKDFRMHQRTFGPVLQHLPPRARILDLGCGVGFLLSWLARQPGIVTFGADASPTQLEIARRNLPTVEFTCADGLEYLQSNRDSFDGIFCTDVLEHIPGTDLCIEWVQAAKAALRPGGFFVCRGPNGANLTASYSRYIDLTHERIFTEASILQLIDAGGLSDGRILPIYGGNMAAQIRLALEAGLHRMLFRLCGQGQVRHFTYNVCAIGYRGG